MKTALITGITGQDGSYLTELLLDKGYDVHGIVRRSSSVVRSRIDHLTRNSSIYQKRLHLHYADLDDATTIRRLLNRIRPDELYHLAGQTHVAVSFEVPESTCQFAAMGTLGLLEILRDCESPPRFLNISSSEVYGAPVETPQNELTAHRPVTPYGVAKSFATHMVRVYRESFGLFACNAICFNHESPRRGESFVTKKITRSAARIKRGLESKLILGSLDARRDWGYAPDFVNAFWRILQTESAGDLVLSTGILHQVRDWLEVAFEHVGLNWSDYVEFDERYMRKADPQTLVGDSKLAQERIGWSPQMSFEDMVRAMVDADLVDHGS
ncbi:MAG: GDP-mannose 4,6-dehydratase [Planctomycetales bacterium]|nr:GDP-mannose 4,6-dehydratase [Planctomycetales bacterium]